jgi:MoaA/NifB/PqqE/SkfB family radical SAM enzyme
MRDVGHLHNVSKLLGMIIREGSNSVKINTVVTKQNIVDLQDVHSFFKTYTCVRRWNLFEFTPLRGTSIINSQEFELSPADEKKVLVTVRKISSSDERIMIKYRRKKAIESSYFVISPNAEVVSDTIGASETVVGNLLYDSIESIEEKLPFDYSTYGARTANKHLIIV